MKNSLKYLLLFVILFFIADQLTGLIFGHVFPGITFGTYGKINKSLKADQKILIFGSSRAEHHYNPEVIDKETDMTCFNTGLGGYGIFYNYALFNELIKYHKPNIILLDLSPNVLVDPKAYAKLNIFMPYYFNYPTFREIIKLDPDYSWFKTLFKTYVYNSTVYDLFRGEISINRLKNGYKGLSNQLDESTYVPMHLSPSEKIDNNEKMYLLKFMDLAKKNNIRLICIVSPTYDKFDKQNRIIGELKQLVKLQGIEFYDFSNYNEFYKRPEYFKDQLHLNKKGSELFSKILSEEVLIQ